MPLTKKQVEKLYDILCGEKKEQNTRKILIVEDGSVDTDKLDFLGIDYIVYREGSKPPYFIEIGD